MSSNAPNLVEPAIFRIPFEGATAAIPGKDAVGSKAHNLMRMAARGLPVPPGFVISTDVCRSFLSDGARALAGLDPALRRELEWLGSVTGRRFGDVKKPLLVSVRSGAAISMPGMMETVLNVGLNDATLSGLVRLTGNPRLAQDCRMRLVQQFGEVVHRIPAARFDDKISEAMAASQAASVAELATADLGQLSAAFAEIYEAAVGEPFPADVEVQLRAAVEAVLVSWSSERAKSYRKLNHIPDSLGTAVTVQAMVFGNLGATSGAGVGFTRNPATGSDELYVDFLASAQGEDVVAGRQRAAGLEDMQRRAPDAYRALVAAKNTLEREFHDMQDFEFTVEEGQLKLLQTRAGKRTPLAALRIARDLAAENIATRDEALRTLTGLKLDEIEETGIEVPAGHTPIMTGTPAGAGVAVGAAVFDPDRALELSHHKRAVILVRPTAETADIAALSASAGLVTARGARTSHAAVVARQLGKPCIVACSALSIDPSGRQATIGSEKVAEGDPISIDATTGQVFKGEYEIVRRRPLQLIGELRAWQKEAGVGMGDAKPKRASR